MSPHLTVSFRNVYADMLKHGRWVQSKDGWYRDRSPGAIRDFLRQFSKQDREKIKEGFEDTPKQKTSKTLLSIIKSAHLLNKKDRDELLSDLQGQQ